jgi:hypothetical protein
VSLLVAVPPAAAKQFQEHTQKNNTTHCIVVFTQKNKIKQE